MSVDDPKTLAAFVLEEFSERAGRDVDARENGAFSLQPGGPTAPPSQRGIAPQRRYQGTEAAGAKLDAADVAELRGSDEAVRRLAELRASPESTRTAARRLGVSAKTIQSARDGRTYADTRPLCPICRAEQNWPNLPPVPGCRPNCPTYGRRTPSPQPPPFFPAPLPAPPKAPKGKGESGHTWLDATPMLDRVRAWEVLERACDAWAQHREEAVRGPTSPLALLRLESEIELATQALRKLRGAEGH